MSKRSLLPCAILVISQGASAAAPLPIVGGQMQQISPVQTIPVERPRVGTTVNSPGAPVEVTTPVAETRLLVRRLRVTGATLYPEADLVALTGFQAGTELTLTDLRRMAAKIAEHYQRNGHFVAQAYLPAQDIQDGVVDIAVIEGRYGRVSVNNQARLPDGLASSHMEGLNPGDPVASAPLEERLLLLSDVPGVTVRSTLVPGASLGASDLMVDILPGKPVTGSIDADNAGNRYTGAYRLGGTVHVNNPSGLGDMVSLRVLTSGSGLQYARASYQVPLGKAKVGVAYSHMRYALGREFDSLGASGTARIASVFGNYPLVRSRNSNLYAGLALDVKRFEDRMDTPPSHREKRAEVLMASLYGDQSGGGGTSGYSLTWSAGRLDLQGADARTTDAASARSNGHFNKLGFMANRVQSLGDTFSLYGAVQGQVASKNLDVSEKMELGGMYAVRAFPEGEAYADQGYVLTLEARMRLQPLVTKAPGQMYFIVFVDAGAVRTHRNPWDTSANRRTLSGAGVGLNWIAANDLVVKAYYARKLGHDVATSAPDRSGRFWVQLVKYF